MNQFLSAPVTDAQLQRDALLGALAGLAPWRRLGRLKEG